MSFFVCDVFDDGDSGPVFKVRRYLLVLSQVSRKIQLWIYELDSNSYDDIAAQPICTEKSENYEEHCCLTRIIANLLRVNMFNIWQARFLWTFLSLKPFLEAIGRDLCIFFLCFLWSSHRQLSFIIFSTLNYWEWNFYWEVKFCCFCKTHTKKCKLICSGWYYSSFAQYIEIFEARIWWLTWESILGFYQSLFVKCASGFVGWCLCWSEWWHSEMLGRF